MVATSDFRNGMVLRLDGELFSMSEFEHFKPGKGASVVRTKLKNVKTGAVIDRTFRSGDKVEDVRLERRKMQYLYRSDALFTFMDNETYEQYELDEGTVGGAVKYLKENDPCDVLVTENQAIGVELPIFVALEVIQTDPGVRGDTASGGSKPATVETGATVQVPLFVEQGDVLKIDTRTDTYVERV
ncbi:MAG: elongation factor P [Gemmatimonadetes bacterium]|nr:elongation factor P [Gemmatimonadota bacterium]|tara:strand:- start:2808 stop:3365 length:558 start_codon:yes stop_codon:yes gene_type:complete